MYGSESVIPAEIEVQTLRVKSYDEFTNSEGRMLDLEFLNEKRVSARVKILQYQAAVARAYNKNVCNREFQVGDLVLRNVAVQKHVGKLEPKWEGPYRVIKANSNGSYELEEIDGKVLPRPWHANNLQKFYC